LADNNKLDLVATVVSNYLRRNSIAVDQIGTVVSSVTRALEQASRQLVGAPSEAAAHEAAVVSEAQKPAVPVRRSVQPDHIVCLEDGMKVKTLKRHLQSAHGMTPQQYREKWGLARDYPMTAPAYSERRSQMARDLGLGRKAGEAPSRRGRRPAQAAAES
jgi:predicted transcriptional regulator